MVCPPLKPSVDLRMPRDHFVFASHSPDDSVARRTSRFRRTAQNVGRQSKSIIPTIFARTEGPNVGTAPLVLTVSEKFVRTDDGAPTGPLGSLGADIWPVNICYAGLRCEHGPDHARYYFEPRTFSEDLGRAPDALLREERKHVLGRGGDPQDRRKHRDRGSTGERDSCRRLPVLIFGRQ
jgi:hypothetical protein